jgi:hypothetical protein
MKISMTFSISFSSGGGSFIAISRTRIKTHEIIYLFI